MEITSDKNFENDESFYKNLPSVVLNSNWGKKPATWKQKAKMKELDLSFNKDITKAEAFFKIGIFLRNTPS